MDLVKKYCFIQSLKIDEQPAEVSQDQADADSVASTQDETKASDVPQEKQTDRSPEIDQSPPEETKEDGADGDQDQEESEYYDEEDYASEESAGEESSLVTRKKNITEEDCRQLSFMRLGFLDLGPTIENLEAYPGIKYLYLQYNKFTSIAENAFKFNTNLQFLAIQHN